MEEEIKVDLSREKCSLNNSGYIKSIQWYSIFHIFEKNTNFGVPMLLMMLVYRKKRNSALSVIDQKILPINLGCSAFGLYGSNSHLPIHATISFSPNPDCYQSFIFLQPKY